jgi:Tol biopolymer transport system component
VLLVHLHAQADLPMTCPAPLRHAAAAALVTCVSACADGGSVLQPGEPAVAFLIAPSPDAAQEVHVQDIQTGAHQPVSGTGPEGSAFRSLGVGADGRYLAFTADHRTLGTPEVFVVDLMGPSHPRRVDLPVGEDRGAGRLTLDPDGRRAAVFVEAEHPELYELFVVDLASRNVQRLTHAAAPHVPRRSYNQGVARWSPDGAWLAFTADHHIPNVFDLYLVSAEGHGLRRLTDLSPYDGDGDGVPDNAISVARDFVWSADGRWVYFHLEAHRPEWGRAAGREVWAASPDAAAPVRLYPDATGPIGDADGDGVLDGKVWGCPVAPAAGGAYAFSVHTDEGGSDLLLVDAPTAGATRLTEDAAVGQIAWHPSGGAIAFVHTDRRRLWRLPLDGGSPHPLGSLPGGAATGTRYACGAETIRWSPTGDEVAYVSSEEDPLHALYVARSDGTELRRASEPGEDVVRASYAPGGRFLVYVTEGEEIPARLVAVPTDGEPPRDLTQHLPQPAFLSHHFIPFVPQDVE